MSYLIRRAVSEDLPSVMKLLNDRITWLTRQGHAQWRDRDFRVTMDRLVRQGFTWIAFDDSTPIATVSLSTLADSDFWNPVEKRQPALYMSKMATSVERAGTSLGASLTLWAYQRAQDSDISRLRWDAWRDNQSLVSYYKQLGATHLRTESPKHRKSGALFELAYRKPPADLPFVTQDDFALYLLPNQSRRIFHPGEDALRHGAPNSSTPTHSIDDLMCPPLYAEKPLPSGPITSPCRATKQAGRSVSIYNPGGQWCAHGFFSHAIEQWPLLSQLSEGIPYQIVHTVSPSASTVCALHLRGWAPQLAA